jgi:hypothetical protein
MSYVDAVVATVCCILFAAAALAVQRRLRSAAPPATSQRVREEDLVWPSRDEDGNTVWATQDELPWQDIAAVADSDRPNARRLEAG